MSPWWGKSSSKEANKKPNKKITFDTIQQKNKFTSEEKSNSKAGVSHERCDDTVSKRASASQAHIMSPPPSTQVSRCQSFADGSLAHPLPLPFPGIQLKSGGCLDSGISTPAKLGVGRIKPSLFFALPRPQGRPNFSDPGGAADLATAFVSSDSSTDSDDPSASRLVSPQASDCEYGKRSTMNSPTSVMCKDQYPVVTQKKLETSNTENILWNNQISPTSSKKERHSHIANLQIPHRAAFGNAADSWISSPSGSPLRRFGPEPVMNKSFYVGKPYSDIALVGSGHSSSPGSGYNSGNSSVTCDTPGKIFLQHSRCSPECSPIPSPRMTSPGPSSRVHSGAVTPHHPRAGGSVMESPTSRLDDGKQQSHQLPLPPITCHFSPAYSPATTPFPRSPGRAENPTSPGPRWKKGRLLGRGTFGHVYLGFNRESGEMCAMKEVTLFSDDAKSKESAQQLGQEITSLSRLRHPNIVQYYGTEMAGDKLYIYLEFVSGGSIHKLLQDYGMLGEIALRSYTQQILSGLAYLHGKNTVHRDIKGANILVDPNGRVKLADFGMAKHITGYSCPLSFKGSPYWMAPEVIKNSNGCNLAVDIWSLGCTVLEMASAKPPWSQYEGVAALFKIGNSKELPAIPDHLSDDGKDFVMKCLQRNPLLRPTASQLLEHPFVRNTAPLERSIMSDLLDSTYTVFGAAVSLGIGEGMATYGTRVSTIGSGSSETHMPRNISGPVSPIGSPRLHSRSPQQMSGRLSPSPISSPCTASGSSTPLTGGIGAIPIQNTAKQPLHYGIETVPRSPTRLYAGPNTCYQGPSQVSGVSRDAMSSENITIGKNQDLYNRQSVLADRVSQQLLRGHVKLKPSVDLTRNTQTLDRVK